MLEIQVLTMSENSGVDGEKQITLSKAKLSKCCSGDVSSSLALCTAILISIKQKNISSKGNPAIMIQVPKNLVVPCHGARVQVPSCTSKHNV